MHRFYCFRHKLAIKHICATLNIYVLLTAMYESAAIQREHIVVSIRTAVMRTRRNVNFYVHSLSRLMSEQVVFIVTTRLCNFLYYCDIIGKGQRNIKCAGNIWTPSSFASIWEFGEIIARNLDMYLEAVQNLL